MYTDYFEFREKPFSVTPDPRFFYTNPSYQEAYASLCYGIHERRGFIVLTGEVGTGKTTLLRRLMENMERHVRFVFFYNTNLTFEEFLEMICEEFGLPLKEARRVQKIQAMNQFLIDQLAQGGTVVLLIDEAQNLSEEVLENLRLLSNLETAKEKLLQIVLVGQPELQTKLAQPSLRQLRQRIAIQCRLERLAAEEVSSYIHYRLHAVGYERQELFTSDAIQEIASYTMGFPRLINILCDNALLLAYATSQQRVTADILREAAQDLRLDLPTGAAHIAAEPQQWSGQIKRNRTSGGKHSARKSYRGKPSRGSWRRVRIIIAGLLLGLGGIGVYTWQVDASFLRHVRERVETLPPTLKDLIGGWFGHRTASKSLLEGNQNAADAVQPAMLLAEMSLSSAIGLQSLEPSRESQSNHLLSEQIGPSSQNNSAIDGRGEATQIGIAASNSEAASWREKPIIVQPGSTIVEIAATLYGAQRNLGLELIKEHNPHIENLNRILVGQRLWLPPLSRETLVRQWSDGSYSLLLGAFRSAQQAEQLAQLVRLQAYAVVVTPRRLSDNLTLHRVTLSPLKDLEAVNLAWGTALANQWLALAEDRAGNRF